LGGGYGTKRRMRKKINESIYAARLGGDCAANWAAVMVQKEE